MPAIILPHDPADLSAGIDLHYSEHVEHVELSVVSGNLRFRLRTASGARYDVHGAVAAMGALQVLDLRNLPATAVEAVRKHGVLSKELAQAIGSAINQFTGGAVDFIASAVVTENQPPEPAEPVDPTALGGTYFSRLTPQAQSIVAASPALCALSSLIARIDSARGSSEGISKADERARSIAVRGIVAELRARGIT